MSKNFILPLITLLAFTGCTSYESVEKHITLDQLIIKFDLTANTEELKSGPGIFAQAELDSIYDILNTIEIRRGKRIVMSADQFTITLRGIKDGEVNQQKSNNCNDPYMVLMPASCATGGHISATHPAGYGAPYGFAVDFDYDAVPNGTMNHGWTATEISSHLYGFSGPLNWHQISTNSRWGARGLVVNVYGYLSVTGSGGYRTGSYHLELIFDPITNNWSMTIE